MDAQNSAESAPKRKVIGRPFVKGQASANPGGGPKATPDVRAMFRQNTPEALAASRKEHEAGALSRCCCSDHPRLWLGTPDDSGPMLCRPMPASNGGFRQAYRHCADTKMALAWALG